MNPARELRKLATELQAMHLGSEDKFTHMDDRTLSKFINLIKGAVVVDSRGKNWAIPADNPGEITESEGDWDFYINYVDDKGHKYSNRTLYLLENILDEGNKILKDGKDIIQAVVNLIKPGYSGVFFERGLPE